MVHVPLCIVFLIFSDRWLKNGKIISHFDCWYCWRAFAFFIIIFTTVVSKFITFTAWVVDSPESFEETTGMTTKWFIIETCWVFVRTGLEIYLCFTFFSIKEFLKVLNRSDDFDGEHFDNVSQSKSEKERVERHKKKCEDMQEAKEKKLEAKKKKEATDINDLIELRMQKYKDFSKLEKPEANKAENIVKSDDILDISRNSNWYI